jgi:hypothetical protein
VTAMAVDHDVTWDMGTQTGAGADIVGREEGLEGAGLHLGRLEALVGRLSNALMERC